MPEFKTLEEAQKAYEALESEHTKTEEALTKEKGFSAKWEQRAKDNENAAPLLEKANARIAELEAATDSGKSELEKQVAKLTEDIGSLTKRAEDAETTASAERLNALKTRIGSEKGLPAKAIAALSGEDEESITADADAWLEALPKGEPKPGVPGQGALGKPNQEDDKFAAFKAGLGLPPNPKE